MKIALIVLLFIMSAWAGNDVENGGDSVAFEFTATAHLAIENLQNQKLTPELKNWVEVLSKKVNSTQVNSLSLLQLQGQPVDAINYPLENRIVVSRSGWKHMKLDPIQTRIGFVLHEYLGVSRIGDPGYSRSRKLVAAISPDGFGKLFAQETFIRAVEDLQIRFLQFARDPELEAKKICVFSGEIQSKIEFISGFVNAHPGWFRAGANDKYLSDLKAASSVLQKECLSQQANYSLIEKSCERGEEITWYLIKLIIAN